MNLTRDKLPVSRWQIALRIFGTVLLTASAVMVVLGSTVLAKRLQGPRFLAYWTWCMLLTMAAILVAFADMLLVRRASKRTRRELVRQQFLSPDLVEKLRNRHDQ